MIRFCTTSIPGVLSLMLILLVGCSPQENADSPGGSAARTVSGSDAPSDLIIFHAASLARPFQVIEKRLEEAHPGLDVIRESSSSRLAIRKAADLGRRGDIVATADEALIRQQMLPEHCDFVAIFARNRVVLAYTERSKYRADITAQNWYDILLRDDVNFGYADPDMAPVGYRTMLCWQLADIYYREDLGDRSLFQELKAACPDKFIRPHCNELIPLLESLTLDYTFQYKSVAQQHHLGWLKLPDEIDLGNETMGDIYRQAKVEIGGRNRNERTTRVGKPIVYGITKPHTCRNHAMADEFLRLLLSEEGQAVMEENFQEPVVPPLGKNVDQAPELIRPLLQEADYAK